MAPFLLWRERSYAPPLPEAVKRATLLRHGSPDATWIETGTYLGNTAQFLARNARRVITIEPSRELYDQARTRLAGIENVELIAGTSQDELPRLLSGVTGDVNFWLDGHYSGGNTYQGSSPTPVAQELQTIREQRGHLGRLAVLIDDARCFYEGEPGYPTLDFLVDWSRSCAMRWTIEHDIFIAKSW